jgi:glycosyltransferase involved in cell wall biosynthesis
VLWVHSDVTATTYLLNDEKFQKYLPEMDKIICVNEFVKDVFLNKFDYIQSNKIEIINNLIDKNEINKLSEQSVAFQKKHPIILSVGGLRKIKRFDRLIRVHAKLIEKDIDNELIIIGDGEEYCTLSDLITELHVEKTVQLLGYKENPYPYMKMADVFVSSSDFESYSLVILEAIILKVPVVATDTLGSKFLLRQNGIGKVVDFSDEALLNELTKVLITPDYALSIVKSYYKMDLAKFNITKQMKEIESMIDSL